MIVLQIFLALLWATAIVAALVLGAVSVYDVTRWGGTTRATRTSGALLRILGTLAAVSLLIGAPLLALGWAA